MAAFGENKKHSMQTWKIGKYEIELATWQGWAGPPYKQYTLRRHALVGALEKKIGDGYLDSTGCIVNIDAKRWSDLSAYRFNVCDKIIERTR